MSARNLSLLVLLFISLSMLGSAVVAQTPDGETPANEGVCDSLIGLTPGLYGLCVAFCEAQDCEATIDPNTGEVTFDKSCKPSNPKLLANYNNRAQLGDPPMPCIKEECPCWTEAELDTIAEARTDWCSPTRLTGLDVWKRRESAVITTDSCAASFYDSDGRPVSRRMFITPAEHEICRQSLADECASRGF